MKSLIVGAVLFLSHLKFVAGACLPDNCLRALRASPSSASAFCSGYLATTQTATTGLPSFASHCSYSSSRLSSACSCVQTASSSPAQPTTTGTSTATSPSAPGSATTITAPTTLATCPSCAAPTATTTITVISPTTTTTTATITLTSPTTTTDTNTTTITLTVSAPTTTITATVTTTSGAKVPQEVDQSGCPDVNGDTVMGFRISCGQTPNGNSLSAYFTKAGYNIEDCAGQCFLNGACIGVTYEPPTPLRVASNNSLNPGTCRFYTYINALVPATPGVAVAVFVV